LGRTAGEGDTRGEGGGAVGVSQETHVLEQRTGHLLLVQRTGRGDARTGAAHGQGRRTGQLQIKILFDTASWWCGHLLLVRGGWRGRHARRGRGNSTNLPSSVQCTSRMAFLCPLRTPQFLQSSCVSQRSAVTRQVQGNGGDEEARGVRGGRVLSWP
jgi:hypothetical protein